MLSLWMPVQSPKTKQGEPVEKHLSKVPLVALVRLVLTKYDDTTIRLRVTALGKSSEGDKRRKFS